MTATRWGRTVSYTHLDVYKRQIEIDKIVMSDTVTTVYIKAFYRPKYWIKIATGSFLNVTGVQTCALPIYEIQLTQVFLFSRKVLLLLREL